MGNLVNITSEFGKLSMNEIEKIIGGGVETAIIGAGVGAVGGGLAGYKVGTILTPVMPVAVPVCVGVGAVGGAGVGFVEGW